MAGFEPTASNVSAGELPQLPDSLQPVIKLYPSPHQLVDAYCYASDGPTFCTIGVWAHDKLFILGAARGSRTPVSDLQGPC